MIVGLVNSTLFACFENVAGRRSLWEISDFPQAQRA